MLIYYNIILENLYLKQQNIIYICRLLQCVFMCFSPKNLKSTTIRCNIFKQTPDDVIKYFVKYF